MLVVLWYDDDDCNLTVHLCLIDRSLSIHLVCHSHFGDKIKTTIVVMMVLAVALRVVMMLKESAFRVLLSKICTRHPFSKIMSDYPIQGGCVCEKVRYELSEKPISAWVCHCLSCRKCSGSMFMANNYVKVSVSSNGNDNELGKCTDCVHHFSLQSFRITKGTEDLKIYEDYNTSSKLPLKGFFAGIALV